MKGRILYHIGKRPAQPRPALRDLDSRLVNQDGWYRPWLSQPVHCGVFLTPNPHGIMINHGVQGHVYAYFVPHKVIRAAGGVHRYEWGSEILIPEDLWSAVVFRGKAMDARALRESYSFSRLAGRIEIKERRGDYEFEGL